MPSLAIPDDPKSLISKKDMKKKRKAAEKEEGKSDTSSSELVDPENSKAKKVKLSHSDKEVVKEEHPNAVSRYRISDGLREKLKSNGMEYLFPIQAMTFDIDLDGSDLVGRARTGQGKTLAFVLPILESLTSGTPNESRKTGHGRPPSVLVLLPTRELASQVFSDFEVYGLNIAPYQPQEDKDFQHVSNPPLNCLTVSLHDQVKIS